MRGNTNIKKERMKSYFIEAAKEIIAEFGTDGISVRSVAEKAGYSYATIYNYYKDLHELLWDVKKAFVIDLKEHLTSNTPRIISEKDIISILYAYVSYYVKFPNIFRFFYLYTLNQEQGNPEDLFSLFEAISLKTNSDFATIQSADSEIISKTCIYAVHGMLMLFFSSNGMKKEMLFDDLEKLLNFLFDSKKRG